MFCLLLVFLLVLTVVLLAVRLVFSPLSLSLFLSLSPLPSSDEEEEGEDRALTSSFPRAAGSLLARRPIHSVALSFRLCSVVVQAVAPVRPRRFDRRISFEKVDHRREVLPLARALATFDALKFSLTRC